jgi:hypothetical protein
VAELVPVVVGLVVGLVLLVGLAVVLRGRVRRFTRARAELADEVATGVAQLRALAYEAKDRHPHGVDSP